MLHNPLQELLDLQSRHNLRVERLESKNDFFAVTFYAGEKCWDVYIEDEYHDFSEKNPFMNIFLVLRALEAYKEADDYLHWCQSLALDAADPRWLNYFRQLGESYREIENEIGKIGSFISSLDYQLRSGEFAKLKRMQDQK